MFAMEANLPELCLRDRREQERQQLADLVGRNLTYVSQLDGLDFALYQVCAHPLLCPSSAQVLACAVPAADQATSYSIIGVTQDLVVTKAAQLAQEMFGER